MWWGSNDELRGERYPGLNGICDEALGFDAFHGFAGRLEFGFAFVSDRGQASGVRNVSIMRVLSEPTGSSSGAQMSGPPLNSGRPPTTMFGLPTAESIPRRASLQASAWVGIVDLWCMCLETAARIALPSSQGIIAC